LWKYKANLRLKFRKLKPSQVKGIHSGRHNQYSRCKPCKFRVYDLAKKFELSTPSIYGCFRKFITS
jgi:hypothetical protein